MPNWITVAATPGNAAGTAAAPGDVTIGTITVDPAPVDGYRDVEIAYTPPSPLGTFTGLLVQIEEPDQSGTVQAAGLGTKTLDASANLGTKASDPLSFGPFTHASAQGKIRVSIPEPDKTPMTCRVRLLSKSDNAVKSTGPSTTFVVDVPGVNKPLSATAYCENATYTIPATDSIGQPNPYAETITGQSRTHLVINVVAPADDKYAGTVFAIRDGKGNTVYTSRQQADAVVELIFPTPASAGTYYVYGPGTDGTHVNPIVEGITPKVPVTIGTDSGTVDPGAFLLSHLSTEFAIVTVAGVKKLQMQNVDFSKAINFSTQFVIDPTSHLLKVDAVDAGIVRTGRLQVGGGANQVSMAQIWDHAGSALLGWIGDDAYDAVNNPTGSGYAGAWFKRISIGGTSPATAKLIADSAGNLAIDGSVIVNGTLLADSIGAGTLPVTVIYGGTINVNKLIGSSASFTNDVTFARQGSTSQIVIGSSGVAITQGTLSLTVGGVTAGIQSISNGGSVAGLKISESGAIWSQHHQNGVFAIYAPGAITRTASMICDSGGTSVDLFASDGRRILAQVTDTVAYPYTTACFLRVTDGTNTIEIRPTGIYKNGTLVL